MVLSRRGSCRGRWTGSFAIKGVFVMFLNWLRKRDEQQHKRAPERRRRRWLRPALEPLEDRTLLSVLNVLGQDATQPAGGFLTFHGGPVLNKVEVRDVFYGSGWNGNDPS